MSIEQALMNKIFEFWRVFTVLETNYYDNYELLTKNNHSRFLHISIYKLYNSFRNVNKFFDNFLCKRILTLRMQRKAIFNRDATRRRKRKRARNSSQIKIVKNSEIFVDVCKYLKTSKNVLHFLFLNRLKNFRKTKIDEFEKSTQKKNFENRSKTKQRERKLTKY